MSGETDQIDRRGANEHATRRSGRAVDFSQPLSQAATPGDISGLAVLVAALRAQARRSKHRLTLVLSGGRDWTASAARVAAVSLADPTSGHPAAWLTDRGIGPPAAGAAGQPVPAALVLPLASGTRLTGAETDLIVYDAWSGLDPDGFGAATGALRGGGLLLLLTPRLADWSELSDPQAARIAVWPHEVETLDRRFQRRFAQVLLDQPGVTRVCEEGPIPDPPLAYFPPDSPSEALAKAPGPGGEGGWGEGGASQAATSPGRSAPLNHPSGSEAFDPHPVPPPARGRVTGSPPLTFPQPLPSAGVQGQDPTQAATPDQQAAIEAVVALARGRAHRPLVLIAHRGRGKSAALGIAAARLARDGLRRILVTAPRAGACEALFRHFALGLEAPSLAQGDTGSLAGTLRFIPPDALCESLPEADLVLVDEAAGIPAPLLSTLQERYPRICFATTVHGYEGTGRGFEVRFREVLDRRAPRWRRLTLTAPIRWSPGDPLEALVFRALLLDASPADVPERQAPVPVSAGLMRLDRDALVGDESTLRQVFGLLVLAHYQTRPLDLRMLLDGPNIRVYCLRRRGQVLATLLAAEEGGMASEELRQAIFSGNRRPRGHLLPQTLSAHGGLQEAPALRYLRVVRIAVHPALARRGLGARLLRGLAREGRRGGFDLVGASFGATPGLIAFWHACGYRPAQMGTSRNAASGEHAIVMLRPLSPAGRRLAVRAQVRLEQRLGVVLAGPLRRLDPLVAAALVTTMNSGEAPGRRRASALGRAPADDPRPEVQSFVRGHRTLEAVLPLLSELTRRRLGPALRQGTLSPTEGALLIAATRQLRSIAELVGLAAAPGREALIEQLRRLIGRLVDD